MNHFFSCHGQWQFHPPSKDRTSDPLHGLEFEASISRELSKMIGQMLTADNSLLHLNSTFAVAPFVQGDDHINQEQAQ